MYCMARSGMLHEQQKPQIPVLWPAGMNWLRTPGMARSPSTHPQGSVDAFNNRARKRLVLGRIGQLAGGIGAGCQAPDHAADGSTDINKPLHPLLQRPAVR